MAPYSYTPLNASAHEIRLLKLLPANLGEAIHIELSTQTFIEEAKPSYEALSYAWGTSEDPVAIYVGNSKDYALSVTKNLASALDHLRFQETSRTLWIDAICVDQWNLEERSHQVGRMADIYELAKRVIVWVGPEADDSSLAIGMLQNIGTNIEVDWLMHVMRPSKEAEIGGESHLADMSVILPFRSKDGLPIRNLLNRSWFERLWIRQEIHLANPSAIVMCGFDVILWSDLRKAVFCLNNKKSPLGFFGREKTKFKARLQMIYQLGDKAKISFGELLHQTRDCKCSDPRDRIYALLSVYHGNLKIVPNYCLSKEEVYQDFCLCHIASRTYENLAILTSCELPLSPSALPSWVPDWTIRNVAVTFSGDFASGNSAANVRYLGDGVLRAMGVKVATIVHADEIPIIERTNRETIALIRRFAPTDLDLKGGRVFDTYCRTLCGNNFRENIDPPALLHPSHDKSKEALRFFLGSEGELAEPLDREIEIYANWARYHMRGRSFFSTDKGHIGLGPKVANPQDEVVVFAGCSSPMVLRSTDNGRYKVVGACFIYDLNHSEALLGPLPEAYQPFLSGIDGQCWAYYNRDAGQTHTSDPRFSLLRSELQDNGVRKIYVREPEIDAQNNDEESTIRMRPSDFEPESEVYRLVGIDIIPFDLV